jgi:Amidohydrolase
MRLCRPHEAELTSISDFYALAHAYVGDIGLKYRSDRALRAADEHERRAQIHPDEYLEITDRYPGEFEFMANAHAIDECCRPVLEEMLDRHCAKAIAVASSYGKEREFLDSPKAEWKFAESKNVLVHVHPPVAAVSHESLMQYRLNEAVGRPYDSTVNGARMNHSGLFDRHPNLQVLIVHMGGDLASILGRLEFNWKLNYDGIPNPPLDKTDKNERPPTEYFKSNILVDTMGFNPIGVKAAIEMCGIDRVVFGTDLGPVPDGVKEHIDIVEAVVPDAQDRQKVFWRTSNTYFKLGLSG